MANIGVVDDDENQMDLPPGFRFHPTDEELISQYLYKKVVDINFRARAIGEVDLNKSEPWELPWKAKMGEKEWYFFSVRDRKYPTGLRTNRATDSGYWKATGKDKEIYRGKSLVGLKKTLVFYKGRAPKGEKTNWVMHEYKLDGRFSVQNLPKTAKNEWAICRVFQKSSDGKKAQISGLIRVGSFGNKLGPSGLPPLMESSSPYNDKSKPVAESAYVPCFSNPIDLQRKHEETIDTFNHLLHLPVSSNPTIIFPRISVSNSFHSPQRVPVPSNFQLPGSVSMQMQDQSILRALIHNHGSSNMRQDFKIEREMVNFSQETGLTTDINPKISSLVSNLEIGNRAYHDQGPASTSAVPVNQDCFWHC